MWQGFRRTLEVKDMFFVSVDEQAEHVHGYFETSLEREFRDTVEQNRFISLNENKAKKVFVTFFHFC